MIHVDLHATIHRPIDAVFDRLVDIDGYGDWLPAGKLFVSSRKETPGPTRVGTAYTDRIRFARARGEVVELERPRRVVFHYSVRLLGLSAIDGWPGYTLEPAGDAATRVHHHAEARLHGPFRLFRPLVRRIAWHERRRTLEALEASLRP